MLTLGTATENVNTICYLSCWLSSSEVLCLFPAKHAGGLHVSTYEWLPFCHVKMLTGGATLACWTLRWYKGQGYVISPTVHATSPLSQLCLTSVSILFGFGWPSHADGDSVKMKKVASPLSRRSAKVRTSNSSSAQVRRSYQ